MNDETKYTIPFLVPVLLVTPVMAFAQNTKDSTTEQQNPHLPDGDVGPVGNADERINKLGNNGVKIHKQLQIETDPEKIKTLTVEFENIKEELRTYGVPTVEEYEENKLYWRQIAAEYHLDEGKDATISNVYYVYSDCCDQPGEIRFQSGYAYDCFYGLWTCHAYAPNWENLSNGQSGSQTLHIGNSHDWLDHFG